MKDNKAELHNRSQKVKYLKNFVQKKIKKKNLLINEEPKSTIVTIAQGQLI